MEIQNNSLVLVSAKITNISTTSEGAPSTFVKASDKEWINLSKTDTKKYVNFNIIGEGQNVSAKDILPNTEVNLGTLDVKSSSEYDTKIFEINANFGKNWDSGDKNFTYQIETVYTQADEGTLEVLCKENTKKASALIFSNDYDYGYNQLDGYHSEEVGLLAENSGKYTPGVTYTCNLGDGERIFYVLEESSNKVSLILGTNLGEEVPWISNSDYKNAGGIGDNVTNEYGPITANNTLKQRTKNWTKLMSSKITLPTYEQLLKVNTSTELPTWLASFTDDNIGSGYWTSTSTSTNQVAAAVGTDTILYYEQLISKNYGIRPVITISKEQLG